MIAPLLLRRSVTPDDVEHRSNVVILDTKQDLLAVHCAIRLDALTLVFANSSAAAASSHDLTDGAYLFVRPEWGCHHNLIVLKAINASTEDNTIVVAVARSSILVCTNA